MNIDQGKGAEDKGTGYQRELAFPHYVGIREGSRCSLTTIKPLIVPGTMDSLKAIAEYVMAAAAAAGLDKKTSYKLRLAVDEIATNIITYGYKEATCEGILALQAALDQQSLTIVIEDTGVPFDPSQKSAPDDFDKPPEQRQIGGLGIYLASQSVDRFMYEQVGDRNRNIFTVNRYAKRSEGAVSSE